MIAHQNDKLTFSGRFVTWTGVSQAWMFLAALYIIIAPLVEEVTFSPEFLSCLSYTVSLPLSVPVKHNWWNPVNCSWSTNNPLRIIFVLFIAYFRLGLPHRVKKEI